MRFVLAALVLLVTTSLAAADTPTAKPKPKGPGAIVFVIDRSGSMQGPRLEAVKAAMVAAIEALDPKDQVAVVIFDSESSIFVAPQPAANKVMIAKQIATLQSGGGTNIWPGLKRAYNLLLDSPLKTRHAILLSDGEAPTDGLDDLVARMRTKQMTLSTVAVDGADEALLKKLATDGGGRVYKVTELNKLSQAFVTEAKLALR